MVKEKDRQVKGNECKREKSEKKRIKRRRNFEENPNLDVASAR